MLTINPISNINLRTRYISFEKNNTVNNSSSKVGLMTLDKKPSNRVNFERDLNNTKNADLVQTNPIKAIGYNIAKAYNILCTPNRKEAKVSKEYRHIPYYMA